MAILKQRLMKSKSDGTYDTIHLETTSDLVLHGDKTMSAVVSEMQTAIDGKAASGHTHTPASIGAAATSHSHSNYVPTSRTVNGKALSANISLAASDVGAVPTTRKVCGKALSSDITITPNDIGAALADHSHEGYGRLGKKTYTFAIRAKMTFKKATNSAGNYYEEWTFSFIDAICNVSTDIGIDAIVFLDTPSLGLNFAGYSDKECTDLIFNNVTMRQNVNDENNSGDCVLSVSNKQLKCSVNTKSTVAIVNTSLMKKNTNRDFYYILAHNAFNLLA